MSTRSLHILASFILMTFFSGRSAAGTIFQNPDKNEHGMSTSNWEWIPGSRSSRPLESEKEDLFSQPGEKKNGKLFTQLYWEFPDFQEAPLKREKFDEWMNELKDSPKPKEELSEYLSSLSPLELQTLVEKMEKLTLKEKGEIEFRKLVSEILKKRQEDSAGQVADLKKFLENPGRFSPPASKNSEKKKEEVPDLGLPPEQWASPLSGGEMPAVDPALGLEGKKYIVLGGSINEFGRVKEDPEIITYYKINADGSVTKTGEALSSSRKVENIQHSFSQEELDKANPGMAASFMIGAMKHALPAAANTVALAGIPGLAVSMALHEGAHQVHNRAFLMLPREQQAAITAALHSNAGNAGGWVGFGGSLATPLAADIAKGRLLKHKDHAVEKLGEKSFEHQLMAKHGHSAPVHAHGNVHPPSSLHPAGASAPHGLGSELHLETSGLHLGNWEAQYPSLLGSVKIEPLSEKTALKTTTSVTQRTLPTYRPSKASSAPNTPVLNVLTAPVRIFRRP